MEKVRIRSVHEVISDQNAKHILAVTQRVDKELGYEYGEKVENPKLRTQEAIFQAALAGTGIRLELILADEFDAAPEKVLKRGPFDLALFMGEVTSQSISRARRLQGLPFECPLWIEITKDTVQNPRELKIVENSAKMHGVEELLRQLVYLSKIPSAQKFVEFDIATNKTSTPEIAKDERSISEKVFLETASDLVEPPKRIKTQTIRVIRDTKAARSLKIRYGYQCQVCGIVIEISVDRKYAEVHHIRPLGGEHQGTDTTDNMLVLCPNHHAMFDLRLPRFSDANTVDIAGETFLLKLNHALAKSVIEYHNDILRAEN